VNRSFGRAAALSLIAGCIAAPAQAMTLGDAIAQAVAYAPSLQRSEAEADAAAARLKQAEASRLPSVALMAQAGEGRTDFGSFFGFGADNMSPRAASVQLKQPLFAGGALVAGVDRAAAGRAAADEGVRGARLDLEARVAAAYGDVRTAEEGYRLNTRQAEVAAELARQAGLRFQAGEIPRTDQAQADARAALARAGVAQAQGELARARAHLRALTGQEPVQLEPAAVPTGMPASLDAALDIALRNNPGLGAAKAGSDAARAGERQARGGLLPEVALVAEAGSQRDQFFPGYRADGYAVGVQARWTLFSSGLQSARVAEARAQRRGADAAAAEARLAVEENVAALWNAVIAADRTAEAARQQVAAAEIAEESLGHEIKVSARPLIDLLDAQRETLGARTALVRAEADRVTTRYRLRAVIGQR
jgi:TolC family type I secretion outer membrane protein